MKNGKYRNPRTAEDRLQKMSLPASRVRRLVTSKEVARFGRGADRPRGSYGSSPIIRSRDREDLVSIG